MSYPHLLVQLELQGYVIIEDFLSERECDEIREYAGKEFTEKIQDEKHKSVFSTIGQQQSKDNYFLESNDKIRYFFEEQAIDPDGNLKVDHTVALNKVGHALHLLHPLLRCYTYCDRVKTIIKSLLFKEPAVAQSMYIYKNPGTGSEVKPHQDATYLYTEPKPPVGFWIALEDATVENGCLWVIEGSHKSGVHRRFIRNPDKKDEPDLIYDRPAPAYPESRFIPIPVKKGTCILLHGQVVHKSAANRSPKSRHAYTFHIIEKHDNQYSPDNWLQEGENAKFVNVYTTPQVVDI